MYNIGRVCLKIAGRDAGKICVIVDNKDDKVLIDGETRRRAVNPNHVEPLKETVDVKKGASHEDVVKALAKIDVEVVEHVKQKDIVKTKKQ
jgi:large subunit ribosomal protein L14e